MTLTKREETSDAADQKRGREERLKFPFTWAPVPEEETRLRQSVFSAASAHMSGVVESVPGAVVMPRHFPPMADDIYNFQLRPDDIWVVTFPKCGTTWTQEMVWQISHGVDLEEEGQVDLEIRSPFIELKLLFGDDYEVPPGVDPDVFKRKMEAIQTLNELPSPRVIKTHLPFDMLPPKLLDTCKVVYVARNSRDACVSFYHHQQMLTLEGYEGDFETYTRLYREGRVPWGDYWYHLAGAWRLRGHPNLTLIWFEDMKADLRGVIRMLSELLGYSLTDGDADRLREHLSFERCRDNRAMNKFFYESDDGRRFIRKGIVGDWKNYFTEEKSREWAEWEQKQKKLHDLEDCEKACC